MRISDWSSDVCSSDLATAARQEFLTYLSQGCHGDMDWLAAKAERRSDPQTLWPEARTVIVLGQNYGPAQDPLALLERRDRAAISVSARNADHHALTKKRLQALAAWLTESLKTGGKVFVATAPGMDTTHPET